MTDYTKLRKKYLILKNGKPTGKHDFAKNKSELRKKAKYKNCTFQLARFSSQPKAVRENKAARKKIPEMKVGKKTYYIDDW